MTHKCDPHKPTDCSIKRIHFNYYLISLKHFISLACLSTLWCCPLSLHDSKASRFYSNFSGHSFSSVFTESSFSDYPLTGESCYQVPYDHTTHPLPIALFSFLLYILTIINSELQFIPLLSVAGIYGSTERFFWHSHLT